jgi:uncharacterized protein YjbI with pentapeptide repeats
VSCSDFAYTEFDHANAVTLTFRESNLKSARFWYTKLENAGFYDSNLSHTSFYKADLQHVSFDGSNLDSTSFKGSNLRKADLSKASNLTEEQINEATLCETKLPSEIKLDPNRDCEKLKNDSEKLRGLLSKVGLGDLISIDEDNLSPGQN